MNAKRIMILILLTITSNIVFGQSKKDLRSTVLRLQSDSTSLEKKHQDNTAIISGLNSELEVLNTRLNKQGDDLASMRESNARLSDSITELKSAIVGLNANLDSIVSYSRITNFVHAFYNSLELSDEENLRQYEYGDVKFDLENFHALISKNARYSTGRVINLSDDRRHDKYFIMLQSIEEIKFSLDKILVKTRVMYSGEKMGLFYNEEQLTLRDNKGLLKLTDWVDLDLYKMAPTIDASVDNFTREDFYKWIDGR